MTEERKKIGEAEVVGEGKETGGTRGVGEVGETKETITFLCRRYRISPLEYQKISHLLGRPPQGVEWALFSALWSEHCSYKSSRHHLKKFSATKPPGESHLPEGENAGVVDLGLGERVVFKMESHNHPSFIEPYQGAATGVGGILRDIFTMGARPIALADYLCFGDPEAPRMEALMDGVVRGIGGYGNSVGVPTITGQTEFHPSYNKNILVNAMALGLLGPGDNLALSGAQGPGNWVVYLGAKTGRDGIHGASMASEAFSDAEGSEVAKRPNVQIGDPYYEKLLIEACLETLQREGLVVAMQDMGAAGLTSSSFEMAVKGGVGMRLHLDQVPLRDWTMEPEDILLSESQERMLLICEPQNFPQIQEIYQRWGLDASVIGSVLSESRMELYWKGDLLTAIDPRLVVDSSPFYTDVEGERPYTQWVNLNLEKKETDLARDSFKVQEILGHIHEYAKSPMGRSRASIYSQYDQRVGLKTVRGADHDVGFLRLPHSGRGLALVLGCRPGLLMERDAWIGSLDAVFYPTLQMSIKGARPVGVTDCLNFGNPEIPKIMSEFVASVEAITLACQSLEVPVVSGNVSFYNETLGESILSTPAIGLVGLRDHVEALPQDVFQKADSRVYLLQKKWITKTREGELFCHFHSWNPRDREGLNPLVAFFNALRELSFLPGVLSTQALGRGGLGVTLKRMIGVETVEVSGVKDLASLLSAPASPIFPRRSSAPSPAPLNSGKLKNPDWGDWISELLYGAVFEVEREFSSHFEGVIADRGWSEILETWGLG